MRKRKRGMLLIVLVLIIGMAIGVIVGREFLEIPVLDLNAVEQAFQKNKDYQYFYNQLNEIEQKTYQRIYYVLSQHQEEVTLEEKDIEKVKDIFTKVIYDHGELYYVNSQFQYQENKQTIQFLPLYDYSLDEVKKMNQDIEKKTEVFLNEAKKETSQLQKARLAYNYIVENVVYEDGVDNNQNMVSALANGKSVCAGYARGYQYLLNQLGIENAYIVGTAKETRSQTLNGDGHAWVMIHLSGDYYYCDPTWGDAVHENSEHACLGYFMMSSEDMLKCYQPEVPCEKTQQYQINVFKDEKCYMEKYDESVLSYAVNRGLKNKSRVAEIKCINDNVYQKVKRNLESSYLGYQVLSQNKCWNENATYSYNDELRMIELYY